MRKLSLGAVSVTALLLAAACGNNDNAYDNAEVEVADDDAARTAYNDDELTSEDETSSGARYADSRTSDTYSSTSPSAATASEPANTTYGAGSSTYRTAEATMSKSRSEIESLATRAFESVDADHDGVLDRDEYVQLALASARDFDTFVTEPVKLMSVTPVTNPEAVTTDDSGETASDETPTDPAMDETRVAAAETTGVTLDSEQVSEIEAAAGENFDDAAGGDEALTPEELRASFLARFEEADQDGDDELDAAELRTFAALTRGE